MALELDALRRTALILVIAGLLWNLVEAGVSLWAGVHAGSVALLAFGLDSIVELFAGGVLVWRLRGEWEGLEEEAAERRAQRLLGSASSCWRHTLPFIPGLIYWGGCLSHSRAL